MKRSFFAFVALGERDAGLFQNQGNRGNGDGDTVMSCQEFGKMSKIDIVVFHRVKVNNLFLEFVRKGFNGFTSCVAVDKGLLSEVSVCLEETVNLSA